MFRELSESEFVTVRDYFFSRGFEADAAGEQISFLEIVANNADIPMIEVHNDLINKKTEGVVG